MTDNFPDVFNAPNAAPFTAQDLASIKRQLDDINSAGAAASKTLASGFGAASASGRSFNAVLASVTQSLARLALREGAKALADGLVSSLGGIMSGASGSGGASVAPFAEGGVIASPTYFGAGARIGLMGERGAEAVMPLARGPDGRLGVVSQGGARAAPVTVTVNIAAHDVESFRRSETQITGALARAVARGNRSL